MEWVVYIRYRLFGFDKSAVGMSIRVGIRIFSIVVSLSFLSGLCYGFVRWLLVGLALCLLHRLKMLVTVRGR